MTVTEVVGQKENCARAINLFLDMIKEKGSEISPVPGMAILGLLATGVAGILHSFIFVLGLGLFASAIAFGALYYITLK